MKDGKKVVTSSNQGQFIVWDAQNLEYDNSCDVHEHRVQAMAWTNYHKFLVSGDVKGNVIYCSNIMKHKNRFKAHNEGSNIRDISLSQSSIKFVTCSDDRTAKIWDFATSKEESVFKEHNSDVTTCDWHPQQALVVTGSKDQTIRIWDPRRNSAKSICQL